MKSTPASITAKFLLLFVVAIAVAASGAVYQVTAQARELSLADILIALRSKKAVIEEKNKILTEAVKERGITFSLTPEIEKELGNTGARYELIAAIKEKAPKPKIEVKSEPVDTAPAKVEPPPPDFAYYRAQATQAMTANNLDAAIVALDKAIELKPGEAGPFVDKGIIFTRKENYAVAIEQYSKAIELNPTYTLAFFNRGILREKLGKQDDAMADFEKAVELNPADELATSAVFRIKAAKAEAAAKAAETARLAEAAKRPLTINAGALNAYAIKLVMPVYSHNEKRMGIKGKVTVSIKLDERGNVVSAKAVEGPKQLWYAAEVAIRQSKFKPVLWEGTPIAATGLITFNFTLN